MRETNRDNKEEKVMKIAVIGGAGVRTVIFINGLLKDIKNFTLTKSYSTISRKKNRESLKSYVNM